MATATFLGVRIANHDDESAIFNLLMLMHREAGQFSFNDRKVREMIRRGTSQQNAIIGVVDGKTGIEATIGLILDSPWYSADWHLAELFSFVHPSCRKESHAPKLVNFSKWCADNITLPLVINAVLNKRTEAKVRLYKRMVPIMGTMFLYNNSPYVESPSTPAYAVALGE